MSNPFNQVLTVLSYIKGEHVEDWVNSQAEKMEQRLITTHPDHVCDDNEVLWTDFQTAFQSAWKDGAKTQSAYDQLKKLKMVNLDVDLYMATFECLASAAGWEADAQGTIDKFADSL